MADTMDLSNLPPEMLAQMPAGIPPNSTVPNLINPHTIGYPILVVNTILMAMMFTFAGLRLYVAIKIKKKMSLDDWTTVAAIVCSSYYYTIVCLVIVINKFGTHLWDLSVAHMRTKNMAIISFMSNGPPHFIWPVIKTTFFIMYLQIFRPLAWLRRCVYIGLIVVWVWYVGMGTAQMIITSPPPGKGWVESFATPRYLRTFKLTVPVSVFGLVSDIYILILPLIAISHLQLSKAKKIGVTAMFSTGFICCMASSVTLYFQHRIWKNQNDYTYYVVFVYLSYTIEMCVGISTSCMPSLARLHKANSGKLSTVATSLGFRSSRKTTHGSNSSRLSTIEGYPKKSPYTYMEEEWENGSGGHEMGRVTSNTALAHTRPNVRSDEAMGISVHKPNGISQPQRVHAQPWGGGKA